MNPLGLFLEPPGPLLTHLHTVYMAYSERLPTRLNPLAERTCFSQVAELQAAEQSLAKLSAIVKRRRHTSDMLAYIAAATVDVYR